MRRRKFLPGTAPQAGVLSWPPAAGSGLNNKGDSPRCSDGASKGGACLRRSATVVRLIMPMLLQGRMLGGQPVTHDRPQLCLPGKKGSEERHVCRHTRGP